MPEDRLDRDARWDAERLRSAVDRSCRSLGWIGEQLGDVPESTVRAWYDGTREPHGAVLAAIARLLGVPMRDMLPPA